MQIKFLYATETGTAEVLAMDMADTVAPHTASTDNVDDVDSDIFKSDDDLYILVVATYGEGDYPISAEDFFEDLQSDAPDLSGVKYAAYGLGDTSYEDTYNHGIKNACALMDKLGATRMGEIGYFDAGTGDLPEDHGLPWIENFIKNL